MRTFVFMSKIHFLIDKSKNDLFEDIQFFSRSRQRWRDLVQRILNHELNILQLDRDSNVLQRYQYQLINEYKIKENERIYKVHSLPLFYLPSKQMMRSISVRVGSILRYSIIKSYMTRLMIIPSLVRFEPSEIGDQTERNKLLVQKRVTIIPPNKTLDKGQSFIEDDSLVITSPKWRPSIDERHQNPLPTTQRSFDDLHQIIRKSIRPNSYQDESLSSLIRKRHQNSIVDIHHTNNLSRLSLRSISYGFGLGTKTWKTIYNQKNLQHENITSSPNYRLPANKIELDINQQEIIRRTSSFKKST